MSLDLFGAQNVANNQATQLLTNVSFVNQNVGKASLFLFSRRFIPDQFRRPHNYRFGGEFRVALQENMGRSSIVNLDIDRNEFFSFSSTDS